jgi:hypothetical protein
MIGEASPVSIRSRDYWFKIVDFLQQNWALVDTIAEVGSSVTRAVSSTRSNVHPLAMQKLRSCATDFAGSRAMRMHQK